MSHIQVTNKHHWNRDRQWLGIIYILSLIKRQLHRGQRLHRTVSKIQTKAQTEKTKSGCQGSNTTKDSITEQQTFWIPSKNKIKSIKNHLKLRQMRIYSVVPNHWWLELSTCWKTTIRQSKLSFIGERVFHTRGSRCQNTANVFICSCSVNRVDQIRCKWLWESQHVFLRFCVTAPLPFQVSLKVIFCSRPVVTTGTLIEL